MSALRVTTGPTPPRCRPPRARQFGLTLLEAVAFLGIAAVVLVGTVAFIGHAATAASANHLALEVNAIETNLRSLFLANGNGGYSALQQESTAALANAGVFPKSLQIGTSDGTTTVYNAWGGTVTVGTGVAPSGDDDYMPVVTYTNVPQDVCTRVLTMGGNWRYINVNDPSNAVGSQTLDGSTLTIAQAKSACSQSYNTIAWAFL
ncbi:pilus assembly protein [Burkholderia sp. WAC0059]|uniref:type 4 pilus major pilin n=1 Tax=Burkholderia sp. WAC0059 TaxID=2066022 RepID=UPI000C7EB9F6|nr:type 4 pilus major pilin [Burkholderia sp. WAC0059]PLY99999.1 pilus assembly protein [Burkholderia sp. WAC0059]